MQGAPLFAEVADGPPGGRAVWLRAGDGVRLRAAHWPGGDLGTVLVIPGRTEYIEKYGRVAADLVAAGYHAVSLDVRGQGLADRPLQDRMVGHVARFDDYQHDLAALRPLLDGLPRPLFLLGHSMGGSIGFRALAGGMAARAAAFTGPMWGIRFSRGLGLLAQALAVSAATVGQGARYAPGTGPVTYLLQAPFEGNTLTSDEPTWNWMRRQLEAQPGLALGGPSLGWLKAALAEIRWQQRQPAPKVPVLTVLGSAEAIVDTDKVRARMAGWPGGRLLLLPGARHEVLMEAPRLRAEAMRAILARFAET